MSNLNQDIHEVITDLLTGEITDEGRRAIEEWLAADPANEQRLRIYRELWTASHGEHFDARAALRRFRRYKPRLEERRQQIHQAHRRHVRNNIIRWAAVIIMPLLLTGSVILYLNHINLLQSPTKYTTASGQQSTILLPDGTSVTMEENSTLSFVQADFVNGKRRVRFDGVANFSVKADSLHPFLITTEREQVRVLGTEFRLTSRSEEPYDFLFLTKGIVDYTCLATNETTHLTAGDILTLDSQTGRQINRHQSDWQSLHGTTENIREAEIHRIITPDGGKQIYVDINQPLTPGTYKIRLNESKDAADLEAVAAQQFQFGDGSRKNPYIIANATQLCAMRSVLRQREMVYFALVADIDMRGITWKPINDTDDNYALWVSLDGRNHIISNLAIQPGKNHTGFFGVLCGECRNIGFDNTIVIGPNNEAGVLAGCIGHYTYPDTTLVEDCFFTGIVGSDGYAGGIGATADGHTAIRRCATSVDVTSATGTAGGMVARICGNLNLEHNYVDGNVRGQQAGGIFATHQNTASSSLRINGAIAANKNITGDTRAFAFGEIRSDDVVADMHKAEYMHINKKSTRDGYTEQQLQTTVRHWPDTWYKGKSLSQ